MKLKFDANQDHQLKAIKSVVSLFEGQPKEEGSFNFQLNERNKLNLILGIANNLLISDQQIFQNLQNIQIQNNVQKSNELESKNFTIEMETGTGKTYTYLRTIYELQKKYNFKKYIIVVPSIAIKEGVLKNLQNTKDHFQNLYNHTIVKFNVYNSSKIWELRDFSTSNTIQILIISIDSFTRSVNIINKPNDRTSGKMPLEFIRETNPIVILDEPQNMETEKRKKAIKQLNPLCTLRYSATHKNHYNLIYSLNPVEAYDLGLVKQIEVDAITVDDQRNSVFISVNKITITNKIKAQLSLLCIVKGIMKKKKLSVEIDDDLYYLSGWNQNYQGNFQVNSIDSTDQSISFANGIKLYVGQTQGGLTDEIMKYQVSQTIKEHLKKEENFNGKGIKVLSLFFIDRVHNYRQYDSLNKPHPGKIAKWFEEIYQELKPEISKKEIQKMHNGYFSIDKKGKITNSFNGETQADDDTYKLIMKDKEKLLSFKTPLRFIFSHSALREGWDSPNVFQICTLNETKSELKKRQEIGRGLRLAVNQYGERISDKNINRLTVITNESYEEFAKTLQKEIQDDCGISFKGRIKDKNKKIIVKLRKNFEFDNNFKEIWQKINQKTVYQVSFNTPDLICKASKAMTKMPNIKKIKMRSVKMFLKLTSGGIEEDSIWNKSKSLKTTDFMLPDILGYIQNETNLTRSTIYEILKDSNRLDDFLINPQLFIELSIKTIKEILLDLMIDGIKYQKKENSKYEMTRFRDDKIQIYINDNSLEIKNKLKTIYENYIPLDSTIENDFARNCETNEQIEFYFKLPPWFKVITPIGKHNPDWAIIFKDHKKIYLVAETKGSKDKSQLRGNENQRISFAKKHFQVLNDVQYNSCISLSDLIKELETNF